MCWFYHGLLVDFSLSLGTFFSPIFLCSRGYTYDFSVIWLVDFKGKCSALWRFHTSSPDAFELVLTEPQDLENGLWRSEYRQSKGDLILDYEFVLIHWPHEDVKLFYMLLSMQFLMAVVWLRRIWALNESFDLCFHSAILTNHSVSIFRGICEPDSRFWRFTHMVDVILIFAYIIGFPDIVWMVLGKLSVLNTPCFVHIYEISFLHRQSISCKTL